MLSMSSNDFRLGFVVLYDSKSKTSDRNCCCSVLDSCSFPTSCSSFAAFLVKVPDSQSKGSLEQPDARKNQTNTARSLSQQSSSINQLVKRSTNNWPLCCWRDNHHNHWRVVRIIMVTIMPPNIHLGLWKSLCKPFHPMRQSTWEVLICKRNQHSSFMGLRG
jgi:hypothetical protein